MPTVASHITLTRAGDTVGITINGTEFPWFLADGEHAPRIGLECHELPYVDIRILADKVTVDNDIQNH